MQVTEGAKGRHAQSDIRATEIMAAAGARELHDGEVVVVGLGLPEVASVLAKRTHAPSLATLLETGVILDNAHRLPRRLYSLAADRRYWIA